MARKIILPALFALLPLLFHNQFLVQVRPHVFSQIAVIFISLTLFVVVIDMPLTIRLFYIWCIVTTFTSRIPQFSAIALIIVTIAVLTHRAILNTKSEDLQACFKYISISMCVQIFWVFVQSTNRDFVMNLPRDINFVFGTLGNKNMLGALFLMSIAPMYCYKKWTIIMPITGIVYSKASASIFALAGGALFYILFINFKRHPRQVFSQHFTKALIILGIVMSIMLAWNYVDNPFVGFSKGRWPIWKKVMALMFEKRDITTTVAEKFENLDKKIQQNLASLQAEREKIGFEWFGRKRKKVDEQIAKTEAAIEKLEKIKKEAVVKAEKTDVAFIERLRNPWLGYGLGTFKFEFPGRLEFKDAGGYAMNRDTKKIVKRSDGTKVVIQWKRAHNMYLQTGREQGLIGMFFLMLMPGMLFAYFLRAPKTEKSIVWMAAIVMICLNAIGHFPDRQFATMFYMLFTFAFFKKEVIDGKKMGVDRVSRRIGNFCCQLRFKGRKSIAD